MRADLRSLAYDYPALADLDPAERRLAFRSLAARVLPADEISGAVRHFAQEVDGFGPLSDLMRDESITDVLVNGPSDVWVERSGRLERTHITFDGQDDLLRLIDRLLARASERADRSKPVADARLPDGSRMHVVLPPIAPAGPLLSIRRFAATPFSIADLSASGMFDRETAQTLCTWVKEHKTICVSGGTGAGKTTLVNALLQLVPDNERVVTIEETHELRPCTHSVALVARGANHEGAGEIDLATLMRAALRMRPDRVVVGEVRGAEAVVALAAMSTGHPGSFLTIHAASARGAMERMTALALSAGSQATEESLRRSVEAAFDAVVHLERTNGKRRIVEIVEL